MMTIIYQRLLEIDNKQIFKNQQKRDKVEVSKPQKSRDKWWTNTWVHQLSGKCH